MRPLDAAPPSAQGKLADNVVHFARVLREAGMNVGPARVVDALSALKIAGIESRADWKAVLGSVFVSRREDRLLFDQAFEVFWRDPALLERMMHLMLPKIYGRGGDTALPDANRRLAEALLPQGGMKKAEEPGEEVEVKVDLTFSAQEKLQRTDFERMSLAEWNAAKRAIAQLRLPLPLLKTRRCQASSAGSRADLRATLRAAARTGGEITTLRRAKARTKTPPLVVLCDISGSMHRYTRMFLHFVHALMKSHGRVETFLFGTRLTQVTRQLRSRDVDLAVGRVTEAVSDWAGGTRIGACLGEFNLKWSRRVLGQGATVLLVSDGLDRDDSGNLTEAMALLKRSARQLIWLNPLLRYEGFEAKPAGVRAMLPHVDLFLPVHNLESLQAFAAALSGTRSA